LPTRSGPADDPQATAALPVSFDRKFRPWRYAVSHSQLKLRSIASSANSDVIEVIFEGVVGMQLKTIYEPLTIAIADPSQTEEILRFSAVQESHYSRLRCISLQSDSGDGLIACLGFNIWLYPEEPKRDLLGDYPPEAKMIMKI
jgi:hypothetical protein